MGLTGERWVYCIYYNLIAIWLQGHCCCCYSYYFMYLSAALVIHIGIYIDRMCNIRTGLRLSPGRSEGKTTDSVKIYNKIIQSRRLAIGKFKIRENNNMLFTKYYLSTQHYNISMYTRPRCCCYPPYHSHDGNNNNNIMII